jgi:hypothetical protein
MEIGVNRGPETMVGEGLSITRTVTLLGSFDPCAWCLATRSMEQVDPVVLRFTADDVVAMAAD